MAYLMEQATIDRTTIRSIRKNFSTQPLKKEDELDEKTGLYVNTIEARTGNPRKSPIDDIFEACTGNGADYTHLLLGHRGCGKSTEINKLEIKFRTEGFAVRKIDLLAETNTSNLRVEDFLILVTNALLDICDKKQIEIHQKDVKKLYSFFTEEEECIKNVEEEEYSAGYDAGFSFSTIIRLVAGVKAQIMNTTDKMTTIRNKIDKRFSEWNDCIDNILEKIKQEDNLKHPIIIFENFDKIQTEKAIDLFNNGYLHSINTYIVYTFPISVRYNAKFRTITQYATPHIFPMIDVKTKDGKKDETGYRTVKAIIEKRAELDLFEKEALDLIIEKTGGSLRDVFRCVEQAAKYTDRGQLSRITAEEVNMALNDEKYNYLTPRITTKDYPALNEIHRKKSEIEDSKDMNRFLEAHVVLEYNGERWHDLHPLIYDFMKENGRIEE